MQPFRWAFHVVLFLCIGFLGVRIIFSRRQQLVCGVRAPTISDLFSPSSSHKKCTSILFCRFSGMRVAPKKREKKKKKSCQVSFWDNSCLNDITPRSEVAIVLRLAEVGHICHGRLLLNIQNCAYSKSGACRKIGHANYSDSIGARSAERFSRISQKVIDVCSSENGENRSVIVVYAQKSFLAFPPCCDPAYASKAATAATAMSYRGVMDFQVSIWRRQPEIVELRTCHIIEQMK